MSKRSIVRLAACIALAGSASAFAQEASIYRCTDLRSRVLYTNVPCPGGTRIIDAANRNASSTARATDVARGAPASSGELASPSPDLPGPVVNGRAATQAANAERTAARWRDREETRLANGNGRSELERYGWSPSTTLTPWPPARPWDTARTVVPRREGARTLAAR